MTDASGRTIIGSILFIDIVGYSKTAIALQMAMKSRLNDAIAQAIARISPDERVVVDTGDGAALCFLGDPEDALFVATAVADAVSKVTGDGAQTLRIGINLGPLKLVTDMTGRPNVVGDGINVAQRIMSFAGEGEILVSRSYYEVVARLRSGNEQLFRFLGVKTDKHVREHQVYAFMMHDDAAASEAAPVGAAPAPAAAPEPAVAAPAWTLSDAERGRIEHRLTERIGPLARIIVKRAADAAGSADMFYRTVAASIPDEADRASFLASVAVSAPETEPADGPSDAPPATGRAAITEAQLAAAEQRLARHIGPLAKILVHKAAADAHDVKHLYSLLARHIEDAAARRDFLADAPADG
jgi:class 3 adenylate cyclase